MPGQLRQPVVAGQFYPGSAAELRKLIGSFIEAKAAKTDAVGVVAPHAGYPYSGPVAGAVFSRLVFKDTFIILGPNHTGRGRPYAIMTHGLWRTPLGDVEIDAELARHILAGSRLLEEDALAHQYEHSIEVQLPFLQYFKPDVRIIPICLGASSGDVLHDIGMGIARSLQALGRKVVILASSDMTHYESQEAAQSKDSQAIETILNLDAGALIRRVEEKNISMCGYAPVAVMLTAARELGAGKPKLIKYQTSGAVTGDYRQVVGYAGIIVPRQEEAAECPESPREAKPAPAAPEPALVKLARETVESYVRTHRMSKPKKRNGEMRERAGVFVSIHTKSGQLRGCIGTFQPTRPDIAEEVIYNAVSAATRDPRFTPITPEELGNLEYSVDVLTTPEAVESKAQFDCKKYGVIVESGYRCGLLLPDLEGVDTVDQQIEICRMKAGIGPDEPVKLYRFQVKRHK
jgi:AmmeMemoRadiSam system protein B/AmmeMemoRadiSam system protein A